MYYKLGMPTKQVGVAGIIFPISWSIDDEDWDQVHSGTIVVSGFVDDDGIVQFSERDLEEQITMMEQMIIAHFNPIQVPAHFRETINKPIKRSDVKLSAFKSRPKPGQS